MCVYIYIKITANKSGAIKIITMALILYYLSTKLISVKVLLSSLHILQLLLTEIIFAGKRQREGYENSI